MRKINLLKIVCFSALLAGSVASAQQSMNVTYIYNGLPVLIPNATTGFTSLATIIVPNALKMTKVTVQLQIQYPNSGDLKLYLYSPEGTRTILLEHDCSVQNIDTTFDDTAQSLWKDFCPTEAGRGPFRSDQPLSNFYNDASSFGIWTLAMQNDQSDSRSGYMTQFSLTVAGTTQVGPTTSPQTIVNAASLAGAGMLAPGELVSLLGVNLGPSGGVSAGSGTLPTSLGGTTVMINGTAAPIAYAGPFRVDAQAPFGLNPASTATIQVNANGQAGNTVTVNTVTAVPGIYTSSPGGGGTISAVNQDGSVNSKVHPAPKGSTLIVSASGLGTVTPIIPDGSSPPLTQLSAVTGSVAAFIGGVQATVSFSGAAPRFPGLYQVNVVVPQSAPSGTQEFLLYINGISSQRNATVEIQ